MLYSSLLPFLMKSGMVILLAFGLYRVTCTFVKGPSLSSILAISNLKGRDKTFASRVVIPIARYVEPHLHLNPYKRRCMEANLKAANINSTPEMFTSISLARSFLIFLGSMLFVPIFPVIPLCAVPLCVLLFFNRQHSPITKKEKQKRAIENELPRFASTIEQDMNYHSDVVSILRNYKKVAGPEMTTVIDTMLASLATENRELAFAEIKAKVNIDRFSQIVDGLIGIDRGNDESSYFRRICQSLSDWEITKLKAEIVRRPKELETPEFLLFASFMIIVFVMIGIQIYSAYTGIY